MNFDTEIVCWTTINSDHEKDKTAFVHCIPSIEAPFLTLDKDADISFLRSEESQMNESESRLVSEGGQPPSSSRHDRQRSGRANPPVPVDGKQQQNRSQAAGQSAQPLDRGIRDEIIGWRIAAVNGGGVMDGGLEVNLSATFANGSVQNLLFTHAVATACVSILTDLNAEAARLRDRAAGGVPNGTATKNVSARFPQAW